jgi:predicted DNA-binding transcriptional regulator AlpA
MSRDLDALSDDALIFGPEVAELLAISLATFHERRRWRDFPISEVTPRLDRRPRWRLGDVRAYVRGKHAQSINRPAA